MRKFSFSTDPSPMRQLTRRALFVTAASAALMRALPIQAATQPRVLVHRNASCGCCGLWAERLQAAGFATEIVNEPNMPAVKARLGVPDDLASCHTAEVEGYVIEGHTPVAAIQRLLKERPQAVGLAVPGMPMGSPGMEMGHDVDVYEVTLFGPSGRQSYGRFKGAEQV
jgi:hypothetical protein